MLTTRTLDPPPSHVTVTFDDGAHTFPLRGGATLTELATAIDVLAARHDGWPKSIDIAFGNRGADAARRAPSRGTRLH